MISKTTILICWFALFLVLGAQAMAGSSSLSTGFQCVSNLALCEHQREQVALDPGAVTPTQQAPE